VVEVDTGVDDPHDDGGRAGRQRPRVRAADPCQSPLGGEARIVRRDGRLAPAVRLGFFDGLEAGQRLDDLGDVGIGRQPDAVGLAERAAVDPEGARERRTRWVNAGHRDRAVALQDLIHLGNAEAGWKPDRERAKRVGRYARRDCPRGRRGQLHDDLAAHDVVVAGTEQRTGRRGARHGLGLG
jgi:hypothetical protein